MLESIDCGLCRLRPFRMEDAEAVARHANNPRIAAKVRDRFPNPYTIEDAREFLKAVSKRQKDAPEFVFAIEVDGEAVGAIGVIRGIDIERVTAELGYWLSEQYWGRGIITSAIREFAPWAMKHFGLTRLHADTFHDNPASARVLEKAGFTKESVKRRAAIKHGEIKDLNVYVMLRGDEPATGISAIIDLAMKKVVHAACSHDCPDACGVLITIDDGRAVKIQGDPSHPVTRGFLCAKVAKYIDRVYSPDRVLYPMRRTSPKGSGGFDKFVRISWDEALNTISAKFRSIADAHGPEAILPFSYGGTLGTLNNASMDRRFFHRLGASQLDRTICSTAGEAGLLSVQGAKLGTEPEQFRHSKYIIAWASNIHGNNVHLWPFIEEARRDGAKLVVIDPYRTRTAECADWFLPIVPGTDAALALGMMHVIISENLYDADYVTKYTIGFEELRERAEEYTPEKVSGWTGIAAEDIRKLAREYATVRPAVIRLNYGIQRGDHGGMATRAVGILPVLTGSWKEIGGGLQMSLSGAYPLNGEALKRSDLMTKALGRPARTINMVELGKALTEELEPPVKALFVYHSNPAAVCPDRNRVVRGLSRDDLFTVVHEQFLTDTTDYADIVLPATTFFEHGDLQKAYGHYYLQTSPKAIEPLGECKSNVDTFRALAKKMGFTEMCFEDTDEQMIDDALKTDHPWLRGITRERLDQESHIRLKFNDDGPFLPFAEGKFATPSGKAEFYSESLKAKGLDPVVSFTAPIESRHREAARKFPLEMLSRKADNYLNSTFNNLPSHQSLEDGNIGVLEITAADAASRDLHEGDSVKVFNERGTIRMKARITDSIQPGTVCARLHWAKLSEDGNNVNVLTSDRLTDLGGGATFYSTLVDVARRYDS